MSEPKPNGLTLIVVFGAAVRPDGSASPTLARRVGYAAAAAQASPGAHLFLSGGVGEYQPSEAAVMARLLTGAVHPDRLILDDRSTDTLETVVAAANFARSHRYGCILTCTDAFHQPRTGMLFRMMGWRSRPIRLPHRGSRQLLWKMWLREAAAIPYDFVAGLNAAIKARRKP